MQAKACTHQRLKELLSNSFIKIDNSETVGEWLFSFDKKRIFNMFRDYPHELTPEQKKIFDEENPEWCEFFKDRV